MNKTKIETFDYTWNPVTGCLHGCPYCYAQGIHNRFHAGDFTPTLHSERLEDPLKKKIHGKNIFVCSMADLFGEWVPQAWIFKVMNTVAKDRYNNYFFLTKNPKKYKDFFRFANCYYGFSASDQKTYNERSEQCFENDVEIDFVSFEPLQGEIDVLSNGYNFKWAIIGAETGKRQGKIISKYDWIRNLYDQCNGESIPVWMKDNIKDLGFGDRKTKEHIIEGWVKS